MQLFAINLYVCVFLNENLNYCQIFVIAILSNTWKNYCVLNFIGINCISHWKYMCINILKCMVLFIDIMTP